VSEPKHNASGVDKGLEDLESEEIVAREIAAHAPQPLANVKVVEPSIVIAEPASPAAGRRVRGSNDKTLVIRDRRVVDQVRKKLADDQRRRERAARRRTLALWALGGLGAFGLGSAVAWYWGDDSAEPAPSASSSAVARAPAVRSSSAPVLAPASSGGPEILDLDEGSARPSTAAPPSGSPTDQAVDLNQLPVEKDAPRAPRPALRKRKVSSVVNEVPF
jgi:hypothetical protein